MPNNRRYRSRNRSTRRTNRSRSRQQHFGKLIEQTEFLSGNISIEPSSPRRLVFQCQLAQGSPIASVEGFHSPSELYKMIAQKYGINESDVLFVTRNTHLLDMDAVFTNSLASSDMLFAHLAGQKKEVEILKSDDVLGVTVGDNGDGKVFIRKIAPGSVIASAEHAIEVGDHIEKINGESMVGKRHYDVALKLRALKQGEIFTLRLVSPLRSGFSFVSATKRGCLKTQQQMLGSGVVRFKSTGDVIVQEVPDKDVMDKLHACFANYLGFQDDELVSSMLDIGRDCASLPELLKKINDSTLAELDFPPEFLSNVWCHIDDWKKGLPQ